MNDPDNEQVVEIRRRVGAVLLWMGAIMTILIAMDRSGLGLISLPGFWYRSRALHLLICIGLFVAGAGLLRSQSADPDEGETGPHPESDGPVFDRVKFYSRDDCPLCDEAREVLGRYERVLPAIEFIDIAGKAELEEQHGEWIPVVEIDGRVRFRGRVDPALLERLIHARTRAANDRELENRS